MPTPGKPTKTRDYVPSVACGAYPGYSVIRDFHYGLIRKETPAL